MFLSFFLEVGFYFQAFVVQENAWYDFNFLEYVDVCFFVLSCGLSLKIFHVHLKRMCICLFEIKIVYISVKSIWSRELFNVKMSLLIFCLEYLSIVDSGWLKSPSINGSLSIYFLKSSKIFLLYLGAPVLGAYIVTKFLSWWILPLSIMKCHSGSLFMSYVLKCIFSHISVATLAFFSLSICLENFLNTSLSVCVGLLFWGGSLVGSICAGHVPYLFSYHVFWLEHLIHLHLRLFLIGTYHFSLCTCAPLSLTLLLPLLKAVSLAYLAVLIWWRCILAAFFCLGNFLFCLLF